MVGDGRTCDKRFQMPGHNFNIHAKFNIIEEVYNKSLSKPENRRLLKHGEDFWILKLQTLFQQGLNISLIILKTLLCPFASHIKTRFHTPSCSFHFLSNLIKWMSYAKLISRQI